MPQGPRVVRKEVLRILLTFLREVELIDSW